MFKLNCKAKIHFIFKKKLNLINDLITKLKIKKFFF